MLETLINEIVKFLLNMSTLVARAQVGQHSLLCNMRRVSVVNIFVFVGSVASYEHDVNSFKQGELSETRPEMGRCGEAL